MLSVVDLIEAGTMDRGLAAYALAAVGGGASFLIGALPGGAGKTTVMGALLEFVPRDVELMAADGLATIEQAKASPRRYCFICHEIGSGPYYAYLWGEALRAYFELPEAGHTLATNLHADTYPQAHDQICGDNGVTEAALRRVNLMFFLSVRRRGGQTRRRIEDVWESNGRESHRRVFSMDGGGSLPESTELVGPDEMARAREIIDRLMAEGARTIDDARAMILEMMEPQNRRGAE